MLPAVACCCLLLPAAACCCLQENGSLPRGPDEPAETWRATARLGWSCHSSLVWCKEQEKPTWVTLCSRILEKTSLYTMLTLEVVLDRCVDLGLLGSNIKTVVLWSDSGPHYRSSRALGCISKHWPVKYGTNFQLTFGLEKHSKSEVDGYFARLQHRLARFEKTAWLRTTGDVVNCLAAASASRALQTDIEIFVDYLPTISKAKYSEIVPWVNLASLPEAMRRVHCWHMQCNDKRRRNMVGADHCTLTAIDMKCCAIPNMPWDTTGQLHPSITHRPPEQVAVPNDVVDDEEVEDANAAEQDDDRAPATIATSSSVAMDCSQVLGWRCSWRRTEPEEPNLAKSLSRLRWKHQGFMHLRLPPSTRHPPMQSAAARGRAIVRKRAAVPAENDSLKKAHLAAE